ncbi:MAG: hypothetical protein RI884_995 [Pseudomonadota bacterium]|jgi:hypothetical protein
MDYRLSLTPRLVVLGGLGLLLMMALLFLLGVQAGRDLGPRAGEVAAAPMPAAVASRAARVASLAARSASQAAGKAVKSVQTDLTKGKP